jgi:hypothetical protein
MNAYNFRSTIPLDIEVTVRITGHSDPGKTNADPDDCVEPCREEVREILNISVNGRPVDRADEFADLVKALQPAIDREDVDVEIPEEDFDPDDDDFLDLDPGLDLNEEVE